MRAREFSSKKHIKLESNDSNNENIISRDSVSDPLSDLKSKIVHKIKELDNTPETQQYLDEIQEILSNVKLGGRKKSIETDFENWTDADVKSAKTLLARYIVSLDAPTGYKKSMLAQWKESGLINVDLLLSGKRHTINEIVKDYDSNPAVQEMTDDLLQVSSIGKGKGEFMLKVMSPMIKSPSDNKGDIEVTGIGTVEVKTNDKGAGRFTDRQVKPGKGYQQAVNNFFATFTPFIEADQSNENDNDDQQEKIQAVNSLVQSLMLNAKINDKQLEKEISQSAVNLLDSGIAQNQLMPELIRLFPQLSRQPQQPQQPQQLAPQEPQPVVEAKSKKKTSPAKPKKLKSNSGMNIDQLIDLYQILPPEKKDDFVNKLTACLKEIFTNAPDYVGAVVIEITSGENARAKQLYGVGCMNNYMNHKNDEGILYINLQSNPPTFTFFTSNEDLNDTGIRLHIETAYPVSNDITLVYPQTKFVDTVQKQPSIDQRVNEDLTQIIKLSGIKLKKFN
jgi:hypothetical protein